MPRRSYILSSGLASIVVSYAERWDVSEGESMRRLLELGQILADEFGQGNRVVSINPKTNESISFKAPMSLQFINPEESLHDQTGSSEED